MIKVYVAGPLRASTPYFMEQNIKAAREEAERLWKYGFSVLCPHLNTLGMVGMPGEEREIDFILGDLEWLKSADAVVFTKGWNHSEGAEIEWEFCKSHGILSLEVIYYPGDHFYKILPNTKKRENLMITFSAQHMIEIAEGRKTFEEYE